MKVSGFFRRFACLLLAILTLALPAMAETIDLSKLSDQEIVALLEEVNAEIVSRGINKTATLPQGAYIAGKDLPAGRYIFTCRATGDDWGNVTVKSDGGAGKLINILVSIAALNQNSSKAMCSESSSRFLSAR